MKHIILLLWTVLTPTILILAQKEKAASDKDVTPNTTGVPKKLDTPIEIVKGAVSKIVFNETTHDFGNVDQNIPVSFDFEFTNKGKETVSIADVQRSCGCTTPNWSKDPVSPGKKGKISATYNSAASGSFSKSITVTLADGTVEVLYIKGFVESAPSIPATPVITPDH